ncbi:15100_t:CDS:1, partial [Acaulospora morrowiae]
MSPNSKEYKLIIEEDELVTNRAKKAQQTSLISKLTGTGSLSILTYCGASILMTVTNKYVLSGYYFNMNFLLLCIQ